MGDDNLPNFGKLLGPILASVSDGARPGLLARLERRAGERYREWAKSEAAHAQALLSCADREDEIAASVEAMFPVGEDDESRVIAAASTARTLYYGAFDGKAVEAQWKIQASAERQGAMAWRGLATAQSDEAVRAELERCATLEEANASALEALLAERKG